ncbi:putative ribonuclease H-like domain-containing protein [Tanacetum coccineum]
MANLSDATIYAFLANQPNGSQLVHEDLEQIHEDDLEEMDLKWQLALLSMRARRYFQRTGKKITINGSDTAGYDKSKVECFNCHKMGHFARECRGPRNQDNRNRNQDSSRRTVNVEETSFKANVLLMEYSEIDPLKSEIEKLKKEKESNQIKIDKFENASKSLDKLIGSQISDNSRKGVGFVSYNAIPPPPTGLFAPSTIDLSNSGLEEFQQPECLKAMDLRPTSRNLMKDMLPLGEEPEEEELLAFRVYNIRTRKVEENLHIRFLENKPIVTGDGPKWLFDIDSLTKSMNYVPVVADTNSNDFVGSKECNDAGHTSKETEFSQDYIVMPLWKDGSMFDSSSNNSSDDEPQPSSNAEKKDDEGVTKESRFSDQERPESNTPNINTVGPSINTASVNFKTSSLNINTVSPTIITTRSNRSQNVSNIFSLGRSATLEATHADLFGDEAEMDMSNLTTSYQVPTTPNTRIHKDHSLDHVIGDIQSGVQTKGMTKNTNEHGFIMDLPKGKRAIGTKWVFRNKKDKRGIVTRNKARLGNKAVLSLCFLYGLHGISDGCEECFPLWYNRRGAPRAWYGTLAKYLLDNGFQRGKIDQTLFIKKKKRDILLVQVYVDDIIFGSTNKELCTEFEKLMHDKFQMSSMGELNFFLGLQVKQREDGIFISQDKYVAEILRKFDFTDVRTASTPMDTEKPLLKDSDGDDVDVHLYRSMIGSLMYLTSSRPDIMFIVCACARFQVTPKVLHSHAVKRIFRYLKGQPKLGLWYPRNSPFDLVAYSDSDYARASLDRKSTTGGCQFLGCRLISW